MMRLRHTDEWIGLLVVVSVMIFLSIILQAGVLREWFRPVSTLRIVLPEAGVAGLSVGADVEVLGIRTGAVRRIVINPGQQIYAEAEIEQQAQAFIRRDSQAVIRRRFGVAGAAYVDISRGTGTPLDWNFAVIDAVTERAPTESVGALIDQVREKIFPILDDTGRATHALAEVAERIDKGEGNIGRLVSNDELMRNVEASVAEVRADVETMGRIAQKLEAAATDVAALIQAANGRDAGVPALLKRVDDILGSLKKTTGELDEAVQRAPQIARNVARGTDDLPSLMTQLQQTAHELELLMTQLRGNWLLGGTPPPAERTPLPPSQVRP